MLYFNITDAGKNAQTKQKPTKKHIFQAILFLLTL
jgi:hypothetical protein